MISRRKLYIITFTLIMVILFSGYNQLSAATQTDTLNQYITDLQKNPNDNALREKIIKHVQTMKPKPGISEDAREHFVMATALQKEAKDKSGYELAIKEYKDALLIAPWWPEAYSNMGILQKLAGQYDDAIQSLNFYLLTNPADARNAQDEIYKIKAAKKMTAKESSPAAIAENKQKAFEDLLRKIDGRRYTAKNPFYNEGIYIDVRGKVFVKGAYAFNTGEEAERRRFEISGRQTTIHDVALGTNPPDIEVTYTISEDGDRIIEHSQYSDTRVRVNDVIFLWKR